MKFIKYSERDLLLVLSLILSSQYLYAQSAAPGDEDWRKPLQETQELMKDRARRDQAAKETPAATAAAENVRAVSGGDPATEDKIYAASSDILASMAQATNGDPQKMSKMAEGADRNPAAFYENMTPEQKAKIQAIAKDIEARTPASSGGDSGRAGANPSK